LKDEAIINAIFWEIVRAARFKVSAQWTGIHNLAKIITQKETNTIFIFARMLFLLYLKNEVV
jgi:hypothetical protein